MRPLAESESEQQGDVSTIIYLKREHSPGERRPPLPFCSTAVQSSPAGSKGPVPNTGHPNALLPRVCNTLPAPRVRGDHSIPRGKPEGEMQDVQEPLQKPFSRYQSSQHEIQAARLVSTACRTRCSKVEHGCTLLLLRNPGLAERGLAVSSPPSLVCLSIMIPKLAFHTLASS